MAALPRAINEDERLARAINGMCDGLTAAIDACLVQGMNGRYVSSLVMSIMELVEKVQNRVQDWKNKSLSIAGRLQLIRSVIGSMHVFWASVFIIPNRVLVDIEQIMRNFLWCPTGNSKGKAKVSWDEVCLPKDEGGLGIRRLDSFNSALMYIPLRGNMSWGWRKILQLRPIIREFIWHKVGTGLNTSLWFDSWCAAGLLTNLVSNRDIHRAGLSLVSRVRDIVNEDVWTWPRDLLDKYHFLNDCSVPILDETDRLEWRLSDGSIKKISVSQVWSNIRPR
nr:hypothetical protein [Tanacetum cinerariifolium]